MAAVQNEPLVQPQHDVQNLLRVRAVRAELGAEVSSIDVAPSVVVTAADNRSRPTHQHAAAVFQTAAACWCVGLERSASCARDRVLSITGRQSPRSRVFQTRHTTASLNILFKNFRGRFQIPDSRSDVPGERNRQEFFKRGKFQMRACSEKR